MPKVSANHTDYTYRKYQPIIPITRTESIGQSYRLHAPKVSVNHTDYTYRKNQSIIRITRTESINHTDYTYRKYQSIIRTTHTESMSTSTKSMHSLIWKSDPCTTLLTYIPITISNQQVSTSVTESINKCQNWQYTHTHTHTHMRPMPPRCFTQVPNYTKSLSVFLYSGYISYLTAHQAINYCKLLQAELSYNRHA